MLCPYCGFANPDEATFCVKCGTPLIFKNQLNGINTTLNPIVIKKRNQQNPPENKKEYKPTSKIIIILGYIFFFTWGIIE